MRCIGNASVGCAASPLSRYSKVDFCKIDSSAIFCLADLWTVWFSRVSRTFDIEPIV